LTDEPAAAGDVAAGSLRERWRALWQRLETRGDPDAAFDEIAEAYSGEGRAWHTLDHVRDSLALLDESRERALDPDRVEAALWLHDVVYVPGATDNEERSAEWGESLLREAGVSATIAASVAELVLATRHDAPPLGPDAALVADIDLSILGGSEPQFEAYEALIRWECRSIPEADFRERRLRILESFLAREFIYATLPFRERYEERARKNLEGAVRRLKG
jgi:predicted metal-dependent HD superfamily phosphohydrolase